MFEWSEQSSQGWARDGPASHRGNGVPGRSPPWGRRCRFPGCTRPARRRARHGERPVDQLPALCRRHYWLVRYGGWRVIHRPDGSFTWVNPGGERFHGRSTGED